MIPFLKCPLVPTFLLLIRAKKTEKTEKFSLKEPFALEFFCDIFSTFLSTFNSDIWKENRRSHVKFYNYLFYFLKKKK